ncbi:MAG: hypothetical protein M3N13_05475, partial [Candidatus Eremiobacteraeota bacterium]|nr:hypothetical protein [Candidatus Eremiobacteraeota bacterium]
MSDTDDATADRPAKASEVRGQPTLFESASEPLSIPLAPDVMTADVWTDADIPCDDPSFSVGSWLRTAGGKVAFRKPGVTRNGGSSEAFREFIAHHLARWLDLPVPKIELLLDPAIGPCCLSMAAGRGFILKPNNFKHLEELRARALAALASYVGIVVLDVLMGAMDRGNAGNHLYVAVDNRWWSIDYACCFNLYRQLRGVGDPDAPYDADYFPAFLTAVALNPQVIQTTLRLLDRISDDAIGGLVALP